MLQSPVFSVSSLAGTFAGFLLGLVSASVIEAIKRQQEKQRLINVFLAELMRTHLEIDSRKQAPVGQLFSRLRTTLLSINDLHFRGVPEYEFEVYNTRLYETEGVRLAQQLGPAGRKAFWAAYGYLRDAEAVRTVIKRLATNDPDYTAYQQLFVRLIEQASDALEGLWSALQRERTAWQNLRDLFSTQQR